MGKLWSVEIVPFDDILKIKPQTLGICRIERVIFCKRTDGIQPGAIRHKCTALKIVEKCDIEIIELAMSGFRGCLRNVPRSTYNCKILETVDLNEKDNIENNDSLKKLANKYVIVVGKSFEWTSAPILVLVGLKYRGNVGTIARTAVQSNCFEAIYIIDSEVEQDEKKGENKSGSPAPVVKKAWEPSKNSKISDKDIYYYSMMNAPLIPIRRFPSVDDFFRFNENGAKQQRTYVATALRENSYNIYSDEAMSFLKSPNVYIFMGTEAKGLPESIINVSKNVMIPSLSSSINVGNAFSIILTVMIMTHRRQG